MGMRSLDKMAPSFLAFGAILIPGDGVVVSFLQVKVKNLPLTYGFKTKRWL